MGGNLHGSDDFLPVPHTFPRPLMHVMGQLDGQATLAMSAIAAASAATSAPALGHASTAIQRPVILIPGCNHANFSNGVVHTARGDLHTEDTLEESAGHVATAMANFIAAHAQGVDKDAAHAAKADLVAGTLRSAELLSPYVGALGRTPPLDLLSSGPAIDACVSALSLAHGAEVAFALNPRSPMLAHPGEVRVAQQFAVDVQRRLLAVALPEDVASSIAVAATVHTCKTTFLYSHPLLVPSFDAESRESAAKWVLQAHCLLEKMQRTEGGNGMAHATLAPVYSLKLKSGEQVAAVLHAAGALASMPLEEHIQQLTGMEFNVETLQAAEGLVPEELMKPYAKRGRALHFEDQ